MFTALKRNRIFLVSLLPILFVLSLLFKSSTDISSNEKKLSHSMLDVKSEVIIYVPNSYLSYLIKREILNSEETIYDKSAYNFYNIISTGISANKKTFTVFFIKKEDTSLLTSSNSLIASLKKHFSASNFLKKDVIISVDNNIVSIQTMKIDGKPVKLLSLTGNNLLIGISEPSFKYELEGKVVVKFNKNSILMSYTDDNNFNTSTTKFLDSDSKYQNLGVTAVFSFNFIKLFTSNNNTLYFKTQDSTFKDVLLDNIVIKSINNSVINTNFSVDNENLPAKISALAVLNRQGNVLQSVQNYTYNRENLSQFEIDQMDIYIQQADSYIRTQLINKALVPKIEGDTIKFGVGSATYKVIANTGRTSYFSNNLVATLDLYY